LGAITTLLTLAGLAYLVLALWGARNFVHSAQKKIQWWLRPMSPF
jgi:hypothetical protein